MSPGDGDALLLAAGELRGEGLEAMGEPDSPQRFDREPPLPGGVVAEDPGQVGDVLEDRLALDQAEALEDDAEFVEDILCVAQHVDEMRDGGAGIAADIGDAGLQQRLGDGEDAFATERIAVAEPEVFDFACERAFGHDQSPIYGNAYISAGCRSNLRDGY